VVRTRSQGRTRLLIQILDFLTVRRRPEPATYFGRYLVVTEALRRRLGRALGDERWLEAPEPEVRLCLLDAERPLIEAVLDARELEALDYGYRERVWDMDLPHIRELPRVLPGRLAGSRGGV
jgi:hypothetical protein